METKRLVLRPFTAGDVVYLRAIFQDEEVMAFGSGVQNEAWITHWLVQAEESYQKWGFGPWAVQKKEDEQFLGYCGLFYFEELAGQPEIELGYRLARPFWGNGYATEAATAMCEIAFSQLGLTRLVALIDPHNIGSVRVAEKLGFVYEKEVMLEGYSYPDHLYVLKKSGEGGIRTHGDG